MSENRSSQEPSLGKPTDATFVTEVHKRLALESERVVSLEPEVTNLPAAPKQTSVEVVDRKRVDAFRRSLDTTSRLSILDYANENQSRVADHSTTMMRGVMASDTGPMYAELRKIRDTANGLDPESLKEPTGMVAKWFYSAKRAITSFTDKFVTADSMIEGIKANVGRMANERRTSIAVLDKKFDVTLEHVDELTDAIAGGSEALKEIKDEAVRAKSEALALEAAGNIGASLKASQKARDRSSAAELLDRKIMNLQRSRQIAVMNLPTIRSQQDTSQLIMEAASNVANHAIPAWKSQMVLAIDALRQREGLTTLQASREFTSGLIVATQKQLGENAIAVREETAKGFVDTAAIVEAMNELISTLDQCAEIDKQAERTRADERQQLVQAEAALKATLAERNRIG